MIEKFWNVLMHEWPSDMCRAGATHTAGFGYTVLGPNLCEPVMTSVVVFGCIVFAIGVAMALCGE